MAALIDLAVNRNDWVPATPQYTIGFFWLFDWEDTPWFDNKASFQIGMLTAILTSLNERRREMAILRSVGARPWHIFGLLLAEAFSLALAGVALGLGLLYLGIAASQGYVQANYGIYLPLAWPSDYEWSLLGAILAAAVLIGCVPAWRAYRQSLADGLSIRL